VSLMLKCDHARPDDGVMDAIADALLDDQVVVMPTETQYALSTRCDREGTLEHIGRIKNRAVAAKPAVFVKNLAMVENICRLSSAARALADMFLPGPVTLVLPEREGQTSVAAEFVSEAGIGIRISSSPIIAAVMNRVPFPVCATSANVSGEMTPATVSLIYKALGDAVDVYVDGGACRGVVPSTVIKVAGEEIEILRHGLVAESDIRRCLEKRSPNE